MNLSKLKLVPKLAFRRARCCYCIQTSKQSPQAESLVEDEQIIRANTKLRKSPISSRGHVIKMTKFFNSNEHLLPYKDYIPKKYIEKKTQNPPEVMYLLCPKIAKSIAAHVLPIINSQQTQIVAETSPGLGLISKELLNGGVKSMRLYEGCSEFHLVIHELLKDHLGRIELFGKDIFSLNRYAYLDRQDRGNRVLSLLKGVPHKSWAQDPAMTIIGGMPNMGFIRYLVRSLSIQNEVSSYGKFQMFALMRPADYAVMNAQPGESFLAYRYWSIVLQLFMDFELLDKYEKKYFIPYTYDTVVTDRYPLNLDPNLIYLVKLNFKKNLPLSPEETLQFFHFVKQFYGKGSKLLIPVIEKWVPNCGVNIMVPKFDHQDYFKDISIYTKFNEINPQQMLGIFREMKSFLTYDSSPFMAMVENEVLASESVETELNNEFDKRVTEALENELQDNKE